MLFTDRDVDCVISHARTNGTRTILLQRTRWSDDRMEESWIKSIDDQTKITIGIIRTPIENLLVLLSTLLLSTL